MNNIKEKILEMLKNIIKPHESKNPWNVKKYNWQHKSKNPWNVKNIIKLHKSKNYKSVGKI